MIPDWHRVAAGTPPFRDPGDLHRDPASGTETSGIGALSVQQVGTATFVVAGEPRACIVFVVHVQPDEGAPRSVLALTPLDDPEQATLFGARGLRGTTRWALELFLAERLLLSTARPELRDRLLTMRRIGLAALAATGWRYVGGGQP